MIRYTIPRQEHKWLYIFEGGLFNYEIKNNEFTITVCCVDLPDLPKEIPSPNYMDFI